MVPKTTVRLGDSCSQFIIVKEYRLQSIKGKGTRGEVQEKPGMSFQMSPQWSHMGTRLILSTTHVTIHVKCCQPGKLTWALVSRIFIRVHLCIHTVPRWLTSTTQIPALPTQEGKNRHSPPQITSLEWIYLVKLVLIYKNTLIRGDRKGFVFQPLFLRFHSPSI